MPAILQRLSYAALLLCGLIALALAAWTRIDGCSDELTRRQINEFVRSEDYRSCNGACAPGW